MGQLASLETDVATQTWRYEQLPPGLHLAIAADVLAEVAGSALAVHADRFTIRGLPFSEVARALHAAKERWASRATSAWDATDTADAVAVMSWSRCVLYKEHAEALIAVLIQAGAGVRHAAKLSAGGLS